MKRLMVTLAALLFVLASSGQRWGLKGGINFANGNIDASGLNISMDSRVCFQAGVIGELPLYDFLYLQPALLFSQKGYEAKVEGLSGYDHFNYLDLPLNLLFKADMSGAKLLFLSGPVVSYALSGESKFDGVKEDIKFGGGDDDYDKFSFGWNVGAGVEMANFQFTGEYLFGLSDITHYGDMSLKHRGISISLSYFFGK